MRILIGSSCIACGLVPTAADVGDFSFRLVTKKNGDKEHHYIIHFCKKCKTIYPISKNHEFLKKEERKWQQ